MNFDHEIRIALTWHSQYGQKHSFIKSASTSHRLLTTFNLKSWISYVPCSMTFNLQTFFWWDWHICVCLMYFRLSGWGSGVGDLVSDGCKLHFIGYEKGHLLCFATTYWMHWLAWARSLQAKTPIISAGFPQVQDQQPIFIISSVKISPSRVGKHQKQNAKLNVTICCELLYTFIYI